MLDESGDLGWVLDKPYRQGGSSRYFTIGAAMAPNNSHRQFGKVIQRLRKHQKWTSKNEKKWIGLGSNVRRTFADMVFDTKKENPELLMLACVIEKHRIPPHMRGNFHLLYAWMTSTLISASARVHRQVSICPDELNAGTGSHELLENVVRKDLWFTLRSETTVDRIQRSSALEDGLLFCDYLAGAVQSHFEDGDSDSFHRIESCLFLHRPWY